MEIGFAVAPGSAYEGKILARIASLPCEEKSEEKNRGGDYHVHASATKFVLRSAGNPGRQALSPPARRDRPRPSPGRPGRGGAAESARQAPISAPALPRPKCAFVLSEPSCTRCAGAAGGRASAFRRFSSNGAKLGRKSRPVGMAVRLAVGAKGSHNQKPPPGPPHPPPSHCFPARNCPELPGIARLGGAEPVSAHRPPFSVGLTTSAVSGSSRRPSGSFRCG